MRAWPGLVLCYSVAALGATATDTPEHARSLAGMGAPRLALGVVERSQPTESSAASWSEWEAVRCNLLARLDQPKDLLERVERLPAAVAPPARQACLRHGVDAAVKSGDGARARLYAARLLWQDPGAIEYLREIRLGVIESYVVDRRAEDAYRSMLRYDLDHRPLEPRIAARFVTALLDLGRAGEAVNWLAHLDDAEPLKLMLRLQAGLIEPEVAGKLARGRAAKPPSAEWWAIVARAGQMQGNRIAQIGALEHRLQSAAWGATGWREAGRELWQAYLAGARAAAERQQLLSNDDAGWAAFAGTRLDDEPVIARAIFAHIARHASTPEARAHGQLQLESSLRSAKLELATLRLFAAEEIGPASLDPRLRHALGAIAEARGLHAVAVRMWQGLAPPPGTVSLHWHLRLASTMVRAGESAAGAALLREALSTPESPPPDIAKRLVALSQEMLELGHADAAEAVLVALAQRADRADLRRVLLHLGRASDANGKPLAAAEHYLRCATMGDANAVDELARQARIAAGLSLARAGYREDARAQFEWVLKNSRDAGQIEMARRELKKP